MKKVITENSCTYKVRYLSIFFSVSDSNISLSF